MEFSGSYSIGNAVRSNLNDWLAGFLKSSSVTSLFNYLEQVTGIDGGGVAFPGPGDYDVLNNFVDKPQQAKIGYLTKQTSLLSLPLTILWVPFIDSPAVVEIFRKKASLLTALVQDHTISSL